MSEQNLGKVENDEQKVQNEGETNANSERGNNVPLSLRSGATFTEHNESTSSTTGDKNGAKKERTAQSEESDNTTSSTKTPTTSPSTSTDSSKDFQEEVRQTVNILKYSVRYNYKHTIQSPCLCCVGVGAVLFVVLGAVIASAVLASLRIVFFRQSELLNGENDFTFSPPSSLGYRTLNYTAFNERGREKFGDTYERSSPRFEISSVRLTNNATCNSNLSNRNARYSPFTESACDNSYVCVISACSKTSSPPLIPLIAINSEREKWIGLGRDSNIVLKKNEAIIDPTTLTVLGGAIGSTIWVEIAVNGIYSSFITSKFGSIFETDLINSTRALRLIESYPIVAVPLKVVGTLRSGTGKIKSDQGEFILADYDTLFETILEHQHPSLDILIDAGLWEGFNMSHFASKIYLNLPPDRAAAYSELNYDNLQRRLITYVTPLVEFLGFSQLNVQVPLLSTMLTFSYLSLFLGLLINIVIAVFCGLSIVLIYSLLMITMHKRSFEHGVMRMLGLNNFGITIFVLMQTAIYAVPGLVFGLVFGALIFGYSIAPIFETQSGVAVSRELPGDAILQGVLMALIIPFASSIIPLRFVLSQTLRDILDLRRSKTEAVKFSIERASSTKIPFSLMIMGITFFIFGFMIYYLLPFSIFSLELQVLLAVFFVLLLMILFGFVVLSLNLETVLQKVVLLIFVGWWEKLSIVRVVQGNLISHRQNNQKTSLMYSVSLSFVLFFTSILQLQSIAAGYGQLSSEGGTITVKRSPFSPSDASILETLITDPSSEVSKYVESHAWVTQSIGQLLGQGVQEEAVTHVGRSFQTNLNVRGISPRYLDTVVPGFLVLDSQNFGNDKNLSLSELLYTPRGSQSAWTSSFFKRTLNMKLSSYGVFFYRYNNDRYDNPAPIVQANSQLPQTEILATSSTTLSGNTSTVYTNHLFGVTAFLSQAPGLQFSDRPSNTGNFVVSFHTYLRLLKEVTNDDSRWRERIDFLRNIPVSKLILKLKPGTTGDQMDQLIARIRVAVSPTIFDYRSVETSIATFRSVVTIAGLFITAVVLALCFFSLVSSMLSNITGQSKEIGVLLSLGMQRGQVVRVFVYEAFVLVFTASLLGVISGTLIAFTVTLQQTVMTALPIPFYFPWEFVIFTFAAGWVSSFLSSYSAAKKAVSHTIVSILRHVED